MVVTEIDADLVCIISFHDESVGEICGGGMDHPFYHSPCAVAVGNEDAYYVSQVLVREARVLLSKPARIEDWLSGCQNKVTTVSSRHRDVIKGTSPPWVASWESEYSSMIVALRKYPILSNVPAQPGSLPKIRQDCGMMAIPGEVQSFRFFIRS